MLYTLSLHLSLLTQNIKYVSFVRSIMMCKLRCVHHQCHVIIMYLCVCRASIWLSSAAVPASHNLFGANAQRYATCCVYVCVYISKWL